MFHKTKFESVNSHDFHLNKEKKAYKLKGLFFLSGMESESPRLRPCLLRKAVRGREATLPAESTLVSVYMRKKLTPLPEPTVLAHI